MDRGPPRRRSGPLSAWTSTSAGVITTPGVAYLARSRALAAGVVISASHNPWTDNGIKVFSGDGFKLTDARELAIEKEIFALLQNATAADEHCAQASEATLPGEAELPPCLRQGTGRGRVFRFKQASRPRGLRQRRRTAEAPELFRSLGIQATFIHVSPDGKNINEGCGALHPETLGKVVAESGGFDLGVTFDGDADRALFCDAGGRVVNGDGVLLAAARDLQAQEKLKADTVVSTTMSNMGLEIALKKSGICMLRANVGDKYVLEEMLKTGATLGGEQSGHIIFRDGDATTGDGLFTALRLMDIVVRSGKPLAELVGDLKVFPQKIQNVRVREKIPFAQIPAVQSAIDAAERALNGNGRVVVRYSGTEGAGAGHGGSGIRRENALPDRRNCSRDSESFGSVEALNCVAAPVATAACESPVRECRVEVEKLNESRRDWHPFLTHSFPATISVSAAFPPPEPGSSSKTAN